MQGTESSQSIHALHSWSSGLGKHVTGFSGLKIRVETGKILGIEVLDHIIVARSGFLSLKQEGMLP